MKRRTEVFFLSALLCSFAFLGFFGIRIHAATALSVILEQQESEDGDSIRYISTAENLTDLSDVTDITVSLTLTHGSIVQNASYIITTVYTSVSGTNGKSASDDTYYAVYTLTDIDTYSGYTLGATFTYNLADDTTLSTNTVTYSIPSSYTVTSGTESYLTTSLIEESTLADSIQDGVIFHAWDWSMTTIEEHLSEIKAQGFTTIQTSPMQPQKDYYASDDADAWWKMYQPLGFSIATENNALGTKDELEDLCTAAHKLGLSIIVDVVANHLAGDSVTKLSSAVADYEPDIYGDDGTYSGGALLHSNTSNTADDTSAYSVTTGNIGMPDLDTSSSVVQERVLSLLEEYIDVGVDGFRFDAAKHIETPSDGDDASDYWTTILTGATAYAQASSRSFTPYYYGEILNTPGTGRSFSYYTSMMSITDNVTGNNVRTNINSSDAASAASSTYNTGESASSLVLWGESHDTYSNNECESTFIDQLVVDKAYALCASRTGAASLYFARPTDDTFGTYSDGTLTITCTTALGEMGSDHWETSYIGDVNKFHNYWGDASEYLGSSGNFAYNIRYDDSESGMVIVNVGSSTSVSITGASKMLDGTYYDMVSGNTFTVSSGTVSGTMDSTGIAVLYSSTTEAGSAYVTSSMDSLFTDTISTTFTIANATSAVLTLDGNSSTIYNGSVLTFGSDMAAGDSKIITVTLTDSDGNETETSFTFTKKALTTLYFVNTEEWDDVYAYLWNSSTGDSLSWPGTSMTDTGETSDDSEVYSISFMEDLYDCVIFNDSSSQTEDISLSDSYNCYTVSDADSSGKYTVDASVYGCLSHTYSTSWSYDSSSHYHVCSACGTKTDVTSHVYESEVTVAATDDSTGIMTYTCRICGYSYTAEIPSTAHTHSYTAVVTAATCEYSGYTTYTCSCGDSYIDDITEATGHTWGSASVTTAVTRTTDGEVTYTCSTCGDIKTVSVEATGDTIYFINNWLWTTPYIYAWNDDGNNAAFPGVALTTVVGTSGVYDVYSYDISDYTYFIFSNGSSSDQSTNTEVNDTIASYEMNYSESTGKKTCVDGGYTPLPTLCTTHTWDGGTVITSATSTSCGTTLYTCTECGDTKTELTTYTSVSLSSYKAFVNLNALNRNGIYCLSC